MKTDPQLHHVAKRIVAGSLETTIKMFELLGCRVVYRPSVATWVMVSQEGLGFNIQLGEVDEVPVQSKSRVSSHVAFISDSPKEQVEKVERWALENGLNFTKGSWSDRELYFDLPDIFVDFVIEVMHTSILED